MTLMLQLKEKLSWPTSKNLVPNRLPSLLHNPIEGLLAKSIGRLELDKERNVLTVVELATPSNVVSFFMGSLNPMLYPQDLTTKKVIGEALGRIEMETIHESGGLPGALTEDELNRLAKSERMVVHVLNIWRKDAVVFFTNSGTKANKLALMMARLYTGCHDVISIRNGYHGNAPGMMGATVQSSNKFNVFQNLEGLLNNLQDWELSLKDKDKKLKLESADKGNLDHLGQPSRRSNTSDSVTVNAKQAVGKSHSSVTKHDYLKEFEALGHLSGGVSSRESFVDTNSEKELGDECFKQKKFSDAIDCYSRSITLSPSAVLVAYANQAMAYIRIKRFQAAENDCMEALNLDDRYIKADAEFRCTEAFSSIYCKKRTRETQRIC